MENKFRTVFSTGNPIEAAIVKSLLEESGIPCMVLNDGLQNLFGIGQFGVGFNPIIGAVKVQVHEDCKQEALEILKDAQNRPEEGEKEEEPGEEKNL